MAEDRDPEDDMMPAAERIDAAPTIADARMRFAELRNENDELKKINGLLLETNAQFSRLVSLLESKLKSYRQSDSRFSYSYDEGGWRKDQESSKARLQLKPSPKVDEVNRQLEEILRLIERHRSGK